MKPETANFLAAADRDLADGRGNLGINIPHQAARLAYYAQFHAAQALIFERTGRISKSHKGVNKELHGLVKADPTFPSGFAAKLSKAYDYKEIADYDTGTATPITPTRAGTALADAEHFTAVIRQALATPPGPAVP